MSKNLSDKKIIVKKVFNDARGNTNLKYKLGRFLY